MSMEATLLVEKDELKGAKNEGEEILSIPVEEVDGAETMEMAQIGQDILDMKSKGISDEKIVEYLKQEKGLDENTARMAVENFMKIIRERENKNYELKKQALGIIPTIAETFKEGDPIAGMLLQSLIEQVGINEEDNFMKELKEMYKEILRAKAMAEAMQSIMGAQNANSTNDQLLATLITSMMQEKKEIEQNFYQLLMAQLQGSKSEEIQQLAEIVRQSIEALNQKIEAVLMAQANNQPSIEYIGPKDPLEEMAEFSEKLKRMQEALKALGFEVRAPNAENPTKLIEAQMKLKELELKQKEVEAKQMFYSKIAEALSKPETIQMILQGLRDLLATIFNRGPAPQVYASAMQQAAQVTPQSGEVKPVSPPADVPSLDDFLMEVEPPETSKEVLKNADG